ncbi:hypothetical protein QVA66_03860 [Staphylococcus chromogenes]|nr:hypothetical protein [Staphylococcus chromogenes]
MTNAYAHLKEKMHARDYLPTELAFEAHDCTTLKAILEVYRDTANMLDAEQISHATRMMENRAEEIELRKELARTREENKGLADDLKELETHLKLEREAHDITTKHLSKIKTHRDRLAEQIRKARKILNSMEDRKEHYGHLRGHIHALQEALVERKI